MMRLFVVLNSALMLVGLPPLSGQELALPLAFDYLDTGAPAVEPDAPFEFVDLTASSNLSLSGWSGVTGEGEGEGEGGGREGAKSFAGVKLGAFWGTDELHDFDEIFYSELIFGRYLIGELLALEGDIGFFYSDEDVGPVDVEFYGVPLFANVRADINILFLDVYGGLGIGGIYAHGEIDTPAGDNKDDDFVLAADFFAGLLAKFERLYFGVETKYIVSDKMDIGTDFEGITLTGTVGFLF